MLESPQHFAGLSYQVDQQFQGWCPANAGWGQVTNYSIQAGPHTITWTYQDLGDTAPDQAQGLAGCSPFPA